MADIHLYTDSSSQLTSVSNIFIDEFMPDANGEFVKVYLYLLRCIGSNAQNCTISAIADLFMHTDKDILRALRYWEKQGVLTLDYDAEGAVCGIHFMDLNAGAGGVGSAVAVAEVGSNTGKAAMSENGITQSNGGIGTAQADGVQADVSQTSADSATKTNAKPARKEYSLDDIKKFRKNPDISELFFIIEAYLKHPLSSTDTNTVLYWYDELSFTTELIDYLVEYCISKGHSSFRYMDKVALGWAESKITTVEQAKENTAAHSQIYYSVMKALGISGRNLVESEMEYIRKWTKDYAFDNSIILDACKRTITATHQPSFEYTDSILTNWKKNNVHTIEDIKRLDDAFSKSKKLKLNTTDSDSQVKRNKFNNFSQRKQDYDQLEKLLLNSTVQ
ncbi:MAG: DnaD domain protein [Lachnobacterium sp.]|nr:DnaD domain protein [Lachnobacterium sp.]